MIRASTDGRGRRRCLDGGSEERLELGGDIAITDDGREASARRERAEQPELRTTQPAREVQHNVTDLLERAVVVAHRLGREEHVVIVGALARQSSMRAIEVDDLRGATTARASAANSFAVSGRSSPNVSTSAASVAGCCASADNRPLLSANTERTSSLASSEPNVRCALAAKRRAASRGASAGSVTSSVATRPSRKCSTNGDCREGGWHHDGDRAKRVAGFQRVEYCREDARRRGAVRRDLQTSPGLHHRDRQ